MISNQAYEQFLSVKNSRVSTFKPVETFKRAYYF